MTNRKHYRLCVLYKAPQVRVLDFQKVKLKERQEAEKLFKGRRGAQRAKDVPGEATLPAQVLVCPRTSRKAGTPSRRRRGRWGGGAAAGPAAVPPGPRQGAPQPQQDGEEETEEDADANGS